MNVATTHQVRAPESAGVASFSVAAHPPLLQRKRCACGGEVGPTGECASCRRKREAASLQRRAEGPAPAVAPPIVHAALRGAGSPLDPVSRDTFEAHFGHDFGRVRIHTGGVAAESARAVGAAAYTVGRDIVFGAGRFAPHTGEGGRLLAHELAHVVQQRDVPAAIPAVLPIAAEDSELERRAEAAATTPAAAQPRAPAMVSRAVDGSATSCVAGRRGAPPTFLADLTAADARAGGLARAASILAAAGSASMTMGIDISGMTTGQAYLDRFGQPPAVRGGFRNRVTGRVSRDRNTAWIGELDSLATRLGRIADLFDGTVHYGCIDRRMTYRGCEGHCTGRSANACGGNRSILVCPAFWNLSVPGQATLLIHEAAHVLWGSGLHGANFTHASCYANFVADIFGAPTTTPACPVPRP